MNAYIKAVGCQFVAHSADINEMLGLGRKGKIPREGMPPREIQGITVWVEPFRPGPFRLRARCKCPTCAKEMPVGRLAQHAKVHA